MAKMFGTDGIRGLANSGNITPEILTRIGLAVGMTAGKNTGTETDVDHRIQVVIGKDTRLSGYMIEAALTSGLVSVGADPILVGPLPTPAIAMLTRSLRADIGIMITASHNPYHDNGLKIFDRDGGKISDDVQRKIETYVREGRNVGLVAAHEFGRARRLDDAQGRYIEHSKNSLPQNVQFDGMRIVLDCAHGAGYRVAPTIFRELGAEVISIGCDPDGININHNLGATDANAMRASVLQHKADLGIALDGDADRVVIADEDGALIDGDQILAILADHWQQEQKLSRDGIVATEMSNLGLQYYLDDIGLDLVRAEVGDRAVAKEMRRGGYNLGGEKSGHIIAGDLATTSDGIKTALQVLQVIKDSGGPASKACRKFTPIPQILHDVAINTPDILDFADVRETIAEVERKLEGAGRVVVRKSGTEPLVRIMCQGKNAKVIQDAVRQIACSIEIAA